MQFCSARCPALKLSKGWRPYRRKKCDWFDFIWEELNTSHFFTGDIKVTRSSSHAQSMANIQKLLQFNLSQNLTKTLKILNLNVSKCHLIVLWYLVTWPNMFYAKTKLQLPFSTYSLTKNEHLVIFPFFPPFVYLSIFYHLTFYE